MKHLTTLVLVLAFGASGMQARDLHVQNDFFRDSDLLGAAG